MFNITATSLPNISSTPTWASLAMTANYSLPVVNISSTLKNMESMNGDPYRNGDGSQLNKLAEEHRVMPGNGLPANVKQVNSQPAIIIQADNSQKSQAETLKSSRLQDRENYKIIVDRVRNDYPQLYPLASAYLKKTIKHKFGLDINPQQTWLNRFEFSSSSSTTFTGWEHYIPPLESKTLTQALLDNYGAEDQINSDELNANAGIYTADGHAEHYAENNEVRLLPKDFLEIVKDSNFSETYLGRLRRFWNRNSYCFRAMSKGRFMTLLSDRTNKLSEMGIQSAINAALGDIEKLPEMTFDELERKVSKRSGLSISTFSIGRYQASDIVLIHGYGGKLILYKPTDTQSFIEFINKDELDTWVADMAKDPAQREELASHFSLYDRQDGSLYSGVDTALKNIATAQASSGLINAASQKIKGDLFSWLTSQAELRTISDSNTLTTTNDEIFKQKVLLNLRPAANAAGVMSVVLPGLGSFAMFEIGLAQVELGLHSAIYGDTESRRNAGLGVIMDGGINTLFGAFGINDKFQQESARPQNNQISDDVVLEGNDVSKGASKNLDLRDYWNKFFDRTVVHEQGINQIARASIDNGNAIRTTIEQMGKAINKALDKLETELGKEILSYHLGYSKSSELLVSDIAAIRRNINLLEDSLQKMDTSALNLQSVTIYEKSRVNVVAYYKTNIKTISLNDAFFIRNDADRLQILLHELVHASLKDADGVPVVDTFYVSDLITPDSILDKRNELLRIATGRVGIDFLRGADGQLVKANFKKKMGAENDMQALIRFQGNTELRKQLLLQNPDALSLLVMELGDQIPGTLENEKSIVLPYNVDYINKLKARGDRKK